MGKVTGFNRKRVGHRNFVAAFDAPPSAVDEYGHINLASGNWQEVVSHWYCEVIDAGGNEVIDGFQTRATTTKVITGDPSAVTQVTESHRCRIDGVIYGITAIRDVSGDNRTKRIELRGIK